MHHINIVSLDVHPTSWAGVDNIRSASGAAIAQTEVPAVAEDDVSALGVANDAQLIIFHLTV